MIPPEENARRLNAGPGPAALAAASAAWDHLADELDTAADGIEGALTTLTEAWQSAAATQMTQAAAPYLVWLRDAADRAGLTARLAAHARMAYRRADYLMVSPREIAANIAWRKQLHQTNQLGQNTHAIAIAEADYQQYWTRNATAMENYRDDVALVMQRVRPFREMSTQTGLVLNGVAV
ncbi:PPE family protein [Mycobacterium haemophilum DSM 44634]